MGEFIATKAFRLNAPVNAKEVGAELSKFGAFTPHKIVSVASKKSSPLHKYFEWDNTKAAQAYRLSQARCLVLSIGIERDGGFMRSFESVVLDKQRMYVPMETVQDNPELVDQVLQSCLSELLFWKAKHQKYKDFFGGIFDAIDKAREELVIYEKKKNSRRKASGRKVRNSTDKKANRNNNYRRNESAAS